MQYMIGLTINASIIFLTNYNRIYIIILLYY